MGELVVAVCGGVSLTPAPNSNNFSATGPLFQYYPRSLADGHTHGLLRDRRAVHAEGRIRSPRNTDTRQQYYGGGGAGDGQFACSYVHRLPLVGNRRLGPQNGYFYVTAIAVLVFVEGGGGGQG